MIEYFLLKVITLCIQCKAAPLLRSLNCSGSGHMVNLHDLGALIIWNRIAEWSKRETLWVEQYSHWTNGGFHQVAPPPYSFTHGPGAIKQPENVWPLIAYEFCNSQMIPGMAAHKTYFFRKQVKTNE